jgi:hypothetical protein
MSRRQQPRRRRLLWIAAATATAFALLTLVPLVPWRTDCWGERVPPPYRPIYTELLTDWLSRTDVHYWRIGDTILLRILPVFDGKGVFNRKHVILNAGAIATYLEDDYTVDGVVYPRPPAVAAVQQAGNPHYAVEICTAAIKPSPLDPPLP